MKWRLLFLSKLDDHYLETYLNHMLEKGYCLKFACEPLFAFEKSQKKQCNYYVTPRKNFDGLGYEADMKSEERISTWRFHIDHKIIPFEAAFTSHYLDVALFLLASLIIFILSCFYLFTSGDINALSYVFSVLGIILFIWQGILLYNKIIHKKQTIYLEKLVWLRNLLYLSFCICLFILMIMHGIIGQRILIGTIISLIVLFSIRLQFVKGKLTTYRLWFNRGLFWAVGILFALYIVQLIEHPAVKEHAVCLDHPYVITLSDFGIHAKRTSCDQNEVSLHYSESDNLYTVWDNTKLKNEEKEQMIHTEITQYADETESKKEFDDACAIYHKRLKQTDEILVNGGSGVLFYSHETEIALILKDNQVYFYKTEYLQGNQSLKELLEEMFHWPKRGG